MPTLIRPVAVCVCLGVAGCSDYSQDSPEAVFVSARKMVERGRADHLTDLIYAESKEMRRLLDQLGVVLADLQVLAKAVQKAYPQEIATLKADAEKAAKDGNATGFVQKLAGQMGQRRRMPPGQADEMRASFDGALKGLFADPYGWLERSEGRLTVQRVTDDQAAVLWDGQPLFGGGGLLMKQDGGRWYVVLPTSLPGVGSFLPKSQDGWDILGEMVQVFDNLVIDLTDDVKQGRCRRLDELANKAGEKAFLPAVMVFFAYGKYMEAERPASEHGRRRGRSGVPAATGTGPATGAPAGGGG